MDEFVEKAVLAAKKAVKKSPKKLPKNPQLKRQKIRMAMGRLLFQIPHLLCWP